MKNILAIIITLCSLSAFAGGGSKYEKIMEATISELYAADEMNAFDEVYNKFARIGDAEKDQWLPYYYASLANVFKAFKIEDLQEKDVVLDQAHIELAKALDLDNSNSEVVALTGFINMIKIGVDPGTRGQTLAPKIFADFGRAMQMDPKNPRAVLFMGQMQYGTAQFFGKGFEEACQLVERSVELFDNTDPKDALSPTWGKPSALQYQKMCNEADETPAKAE